MAGQKVILGPYFSLGDLFTNAKLYHYATNTSTDKAIYSNRALTTELAQPLLCDANGLFEFFGHGIYKFVVTDANDSPIYTFNDYEVVAVGNGTTRYVTASGSDDTSTLQLAADEIRSAGGGTLEFESGKTYYIKSALVVGSGSTLEMNGATLKAHQSGFIGTNAANNCYLVRNYNHGHNNIPTSISTLTDTDITIRDGKFDYGTVTVSGGGAHAISMRYVDRVTIDNCKGYKGENLTALLACRDTQEINSEAIDVTNSGFDHWDGIGNAKVIGCTVRNSSGVYINQAIQFTGTGSFNEDRTSVDCLALGCSVYGARYSPDNTAAAIISNSNDVGSVTYRFRSIGNYIEDCDLGLVFSGTGGQHTSIGDTLKDVDGIPIFLQTKDSGTPDDCQIINPHLIDCDNAAGENAIIYIGGNRNRVMGVTVTNTSSAAYEYIVWFNSNAANCTVEILHADDGTSGRVLDNGTGSKVIDGFDRYQEGTWTPVLSFGGGSTGITYSAQVGHYTRVGDLVTVSGNINLSNKGSSTGNAKITLPFTAKNMTIPGSLDISACFNMLSLTSKPGCFCSANVSTATLVDFGATGHVDLDDTNFGNTSQIYFAGTYRVAT